MTRNGLYTVIGVLVVAVLALGGYLIYQQSQQPSLQVRVDSNGIQVDGNG